MPEEDPRVSTQQVETAPDAHGRFVELVERARGIAARAYAPYSRFRVGAAACVDDDRIVTGCNVENAAYGVTLCAECGLISELIATGGGRITHVVCVGGSGERAAGADCAPRGPDAQPAVVMPCGRCRQLLSEHAAPGMLILTPQGVLPYVQVLPQAFGPADLD